MLLTTELQTILQHHVLPRLSAHDLGRLACTCASLRSTVAGVDDRLWRRLLTAALFPTHPALASVGTSAHDRAGWPAGCFRGAGAVLCVAWLPFRGEQLPMLVQALILATTQAVSNAKAKHLISCYEASLHTARQCLK